MLGIRHYKQCAIDLWQGDITQFVCDAMVNSANTKLAGGGGVDGAIHRAGGPSILEECKTIGCCATGNAVVTSAGNLPAKWLIHAVGPVWSGGNRNEHQLLSQAYRHSLLRAHELGIRHVAFSAISTGVYRFPLEEAAGISLKAVQNFLNEMNQQRSLQRITFVLFNIELYYVFQNALFEIFPE